MQWLGGGWIDAYVRVHSQGWSYAEGGEIEKGRGRKSIKMCKIYGFRIIIYLLCKGTVSFVIIYRACGWAGVRAKNGGQRERESAGVYVCRTMVTKLVTVNGARRWMDRLTFKRIEEGNEQD